MGLFVIDTIAAFADPLHSVFEARIPRFDLMLEASAASLFGVNLVVVANLMVAVSVWAVIGSVITFAAAVAGVVTVVPELVAN